MDHTSLPTDFTEIAVCSGAGDSLRASIAIDSQGRPVQRFDRIDGWSPQARQLCEAMLRTICAKHSLASLAFEIRPQSWIEPSDGTPNAFRTGWALLLRSDAGQDAYTEQYRADALRVATLLRRTTPAVAPATNEDTPTSCITLDDMKREPLLGARLKTAVDVQVPGHPSVRLSGVLQLHPDCEFHSHRISIGLARIAFAKVDGKTRHITVVGLNSATGESFRQDRVRFDEPSRQMIAAAFEHPSQRLTMQIACETVGTGRAKPRRLYKLLDLNFSNQFQAGD